MLFHDRATIKDKARITRDGYLVADALVARANNVQDYLPSEIGQPAKADGSPYRIFRPEAEVFARDALASAAHRPITVNHPGTDVTSTNWRDLAVGDIGSEVLRDGDAIRVPIKVMDSAAVDKAVSTHQEFSLGYSADLDMTPGRFGDADYDGSMRNIRINHLAMVPAARGGSSLRIVDERPSQEKITMKIKIGDAEVDPTNGEAVSVAVKALDAKYAGLETQVGTLTAENATLKDSNDKLTGENTALKQQVADAAITPEKLQQLADARAKVIADAKKIGGDKLVTDGKTDAEIRKAAVTAKLGDAARDMSDAAIEGAFATLALTDAAKPAFSATIVGSPVQVGDAATRMNDAWEGSIADLNAWRNPTKAA